MVQVWVMNSTNSSVHKRNRHAAGEGSRPSTAARSFKAARVLFFLFSFFVLFAGFSLLRSFAEPESIPEASAVERSVVASSGDTLWSIASDFKKDGMDTRDAVHRIMKRNGLSASSIDDGQKLIIPADVLP